MNLPNKLTVLRVLLIPVFLVFMLSTTIPNNYLWAFIIFVIASLTDLVDGKIARKYNLITDFGKFMDPLADKLLVMSAMVCFVELGLASAALVVVILAREFLVTSLRLIAAGKGMVIAAGIWGKYKTTSQMIWVCYAIIAQWATVSGLVSNAEIAVLIRNVLAVIVLLLTIWSGWTYMWDNRKVFTGSM